MVSPSLTLLRTQSDDRLVALAQAGHERAFEAIVERHRRPLLRHARRLIASDARAEEAVQQALVAAWSALGRGDEVRHLSGWLHRIVHNAALNALRGERDDFAELREWLEGAGAPEDELERREMLRTTLANLAALPDRQREALLRIAVDGASAEEVGSDLGMSEGAVRQLLYRARTALRAAATALTPMPVAGWLARAEPLTDRLAEAIGGAGSAGLGSILAKTGVVAVVAGAAAAPAVIDHHGRDGSRPDRAVADRVAPARDRAARAAAPVLRPIVTPATTPRASDDSGRGGDSSGSGSSGRGDDSSGSGSSGSSGSGDGSSGSDSSGTGSGSGTSGSSGSGDDSSGSGSSGSDSSGSGSSGTGSGSGSSGSSGSGSSGSDDDSSGSGSSGTGSGSGTSGSSGSGGDSSGSGSSGSDTSGTSGSSGSGSDTLTTESSGSGSGSSGSGSGDPLDEPDDD